MKSKTPRKNGRPTYDDIRRDCRAIAGLIGKGLGEHEIRHELHLSREAYAYRMKKLDRAAVDRVHLWTRYLTATMQDVQRLSEIVENAVSDEQWGTAMRAIAGKSKLRRDVIEMGQSLGIYQRMPDELLMRDEDPTLGLFFRQDQDDSMLPHGNVYNKAPDDESKAEPADETAEPETKLLN